MIRTLHEFGRGGERDAFIVFEAILRENIEAKLMQFYGKVELEDTFITLTP